MKLKIYQIRMSGVLVLTLFPLSVHAMNFKLRSRVRPLVYSFNPHKAYRYMKLPGNEKAQESLHENLTGTTNLGVFARTFHDAVYGIACNYHEDHQDRAKPLAALKIWDEVLATGGGNVKEARGLAAHLLSLKIVSKQKEIKNDPRYGDVKHWNSHELLLYASTLPRLVETWRKNAPELFGQMILEVVNDIQLWTKNGRGGDYDNAFGEQLRMMAVADGESSEIYLGAMRKAAGM